jgi:HEAT repeat protein
MEETKPPKVFISYSWEDDAHNQWVVDFATRLRKEGVETIIDKWGVRIGESLTVFMEGAVRDNDFVLLICTPKYKQKFDKRMGGVEYEAEMMTGEALALKNRRKFIPVLRKGTQIESVPTWLMSSVLVNLSDEPYSDDNYKQLLAHLHGKYQLPFPVDFPPDDLTPKQIDDAREKYLQYIIDVNQFIGSGSRHLAGLKLDELYITLKRQTTQNPEAISVANAMHDNSSVVILGDPGAGKTTLMRFLMLQFATALKTNRDIVVDKENNNYGITLLPIFLKVAYFADAFTKNRSLTLKDYLLENCDGGDAEKNALRELISKALSEGKALVLLDGLDEIFDAGVRAEIVRRLEQFVFVCNRQTRFIVTSRIAGYDDYPLRAGFSEFRLNDLQRPEIEKFLSRVQKGFGVATEKLLKAIDQNLGSSKLATNQLMLAIMIDVFERDKSLPVRRVELYEKAINILVYEWQKKERGISERVLENYEILNLLAPLAYWIHENKTNGLATEKEVENKLAEFWSKANDVKALNFEVQKKVKEFFGRAIDAGLLVKFAEGKYGFSHLTFREYLSACDIAGQEDETANLIYEHRHSARWEETILLAIAYMSSTNPERAEKLIRKAILAQDATDEGFYPSELEEILHRDSLLAVRCISECIGLSSEFCRQTLNHLLSVYFDLKNSGKYIPLIERILYAFENSRNSEASENIERLLLDKLRHKENDKVRCIYALISLGRRTKEIEEALIICLRDKNEYVRRQAAEALGKLKLDSQESIMALLAVLQDKEIDVQVKAVEALGELNHADEIIVNALLRLLGGTNNEEIEGIIVKNTSLIALSKLGEDNSKIKDVLFNLLSDEYMGKIAGETLGKFGRKDDLVIKGLIKAVEDKNWKIRENAASAFKFLSDKFPTNEVINLLDSELGYIRHGAILVIGESKVQSEIILDALLSQLSDNEREVREAAFKALEQSKVTNELVIKYLEKEVELLAVYRSFIGLNSVFEKWARKDANNVEKGLLIGLYHKNHLVRLNSVQILSALERRSPQAFVELLNVLKNDENKDVRLKVIEALGRISVYDDKLNDELIEGITASLLEKLRDGDLRARQASIWALERLGVKSIKIVDGLLLVLLNDADEWTRGYAADAIASLKVDTYNVIEGLQYAIDNGGSLHVMVTAAKVLRQLGGKLDDNLSSLVDDFFDENYNEHKEFMDLSFIMRNLIMNTWSTQKEMTGDFAGRLQRERNLDFKWVYMDELATKGIKQPEIESEIINGMKSPDSDLRSKSAEAAGNLQVETLESINCLIFLSQDGDDHLRTCAVEALGKMEGKFKEIWEGLIQSLEDKSPSVRLYAIKGLGRLSGERARKLNPEFIKKIEQSLINALNKPENMEISLFNGVDDLLPIYNYAWESLSQVTFVL